MAADHANRPRPKPQLNSIRKRFIFGLVIVVSIILFLFSVVTLTYNKDYLEKDLQHRLHSLAQLSAKSLSSALWQYNHDYVNDYVDSLFLYEDLIYVRVESDDKIVKKKIREGYGEDDILTVKKDSQILTHEALVTYNDVDIGKVFLAFSRERNQKLITENSILVVLLLLSLISGVIWTVYLLSKRHIFKPLAELDHSIKNMAKGHLTTHINVSSDDEIGQLARTFQQMTRQLSTTMASRDELEREADERNRAENALRESEKKYRNIFENAVDGLFRSTREGRFIDVNPAFAKMLGYESAEEMITTITDIASEYYVDPSDRQQYQSVLEEYGTVDDMEFKVRGKDGSQIWVNNTTRAYFDEFGCVTHYEGIVSDITSRKMAEEEREQLQKELIQARKMESIGTLAGGIAHDFNNILASIIGFTELALDEVPPGSELQDNLQEVLAAGKRARDLVLQILTFARKSETSTQPIKIKNVAQEALRFLRSTLPSSIEIRLLLHGDALVKANKTQLYQLFINICSNGAQAMEKEGGVLEVRIKDIEIKNDRADDQIKLKAGAYVEIIISDNGHGIREEHLDSIFEPYFTTKGLGEGTGLGLAVVHGIVRSYGGEISVQSKVGRGSVFTIRLPANQPAQEITGEEEIDLPRGRERILFVDDELSIVTLNKRILTNLGYEVTALTSSSEALELFRSDPESFDLVITDMTMPQLNGDRLAKEILQIRSDMPIILCTGYSRRINREMALDIGIREFADKPIEKGKFAGLIRSVLDQREVH